MKDVQTNESISQGVFDTGVESDPQRKPSEPLRWDFLVGRSKTIKPKPQALLEIRSVANGYIVSLDKVLYVFRDVDEMDAFLKLKLELESK